jgi:hypothetical protein
MYIRVVQSWSKAESLGTRFLYAGPSDLGEFTPSPTWA